MSSKHWISGCVCVLVASVAPSVTLAGTAYELQPMGRYATGVFDASAAEISAYDPTSKRLFVVNAHTVSIDVLDMQNPEKLKKIGVLDAKAHGKSANSVAVHGGLVAIAIEAQQHGAPGTVAIYRAADLQQLATAKAGALPDMLTFSPDGRWLMVANEGEPDDSYKIDPEGSVTLIDLADGVQNLRVQQISFSAYNGREAELRAAGVRLFGPKASAAQDLEPEYIAIAENSKTAWISLQENNAIAELDIAAGEITAVRPLGFKDFSLERNRMDASDKDGVINLAQWPVLGMYQPDSIAVFRAGGKDYLVSANEGDARDYPGFSEEARIADLRLDTRVFERSAKFRDEKKLGRLKVTTTLGDADGDGKYEALYSYGARSFSIWDAASGGQVFDSGDDFERISAKQLGRAGFNADNTGQAFDERSDAKGPEPEGLAIGEVDGRRLLFVGLERVGGVMVYDITVPVSPVFQSYFNNRKFDELSLTDAGDLGPEGLLFIRGSDSPTGTPLLVVANEVSGSTSVYAIVAKQQENE